MIMSIQKNISQSITLAFLDFTRPFTLLTDVCGPVSVPFRARKTKIVRMLSRATTQAEEGLPATFLELSALVWAVRSFRRYLHGAVFTVETDHRALEWLSKPTTRLGSLCCEQLSCPNTVITKSSMCRVTSMLPQIRFHVPCVSTSLLRRFLDHLQSRSLWSYCLTTRCVRTFGLV
jgi:hypothetical protein